MQAAVIDRNGRDILGEGPIWDALRGEVLWVDIVQQHVHRLHFASGRHSKIDVTEPIGWILPRQNEHNFIAGFKSGFVFLNVETGATIPIGDPEPDRPNNRLNDAKVDAWGNIWAGSKDDTDQVASGALHRMDRNLSWQKMDDGYGVANGPAFSLDGQTMFHTDSAKRTIFAMDITAEGTASGKRVWLRFEDEWGYPDGMTTDAEGCIWVGHWGGARLSRFSPEGRLIRSIAMPATNITSCAFVGPDLDRLFVTSSTIGADEEELAGSLFEVDPGVRGWEMPRFGG